MVKSFELRAIGEKIAVVVRVSKGPGYFLRVFLVAITQAHREIHLCFAVSAQAKRRA